MTEPLSKNGMIPAEDLYFLLGGSEKIKVLDATFAAVRGQSPYHAFLESRIEGAQFFDIDAVADQESTLPHMLPTPEYFEDCISSMGISNDDHVVVYDQSGLYMASSRVWWMFRTFGHNNVYVLEGGLSAWKARGYILASGAADSLIRGNFKASFRPELVVGRNDIMNNLETGDFLVLDARPAARFAGNAPEPRPGMRGGHIPRSVSLPFMETLEPSSFLKSPKTLEQIFESHGLAPDARLAVSCGSGVTACTVALALFKARGQEVAIYDGSWSEWGDENAGTPVEVSA
jgi:thiosulfate/3-mercaptopyruvate sulfurtransferase